MSKILARTPGRFSFRFAFLFSIDASGRIHENRKGYARTDYYRLENTERTVVIIIVRYRMKSEKDRRRGTDDRTEGRNVNGLFTAHRLEAARRTVNFPT